MQRSWEYKIKEGIFISSKLYYNLTDNGEEIIKSKGINLDEDGNKILNKCRMAHDFIKLYSGLKKENHYQCNPYEPLA